MTENQVEKQIIEWMQERGWRRQRNHVGIFTTTYGSRVTVGAPGFPDWTFKFSVYRGHVKICHVETKASGKLPTKQQYESMAALNYIGEPAWYADSLDMHIAKYSEVF